MPEGPEVHTIADWLRQEVIGFKFHDLVYDEGSRYSKKPLPLRDELRDRLHLIITEIDAKGKKIIFMLEDEEGTEPVFLVSSLMMEGKWIWEKEKHSNLSLELESIEGKNRSLYFNDSRHFGTIEIAFGEEALLKRLSDIGPDLLTNDITDEEWLKKIRNTRLKNKKIGLYLMEQKYFSGIGNYLRAEILYAAKISPHRSLISLSDDEALIIFDESRRLILESYQAQGATLATYRNPHGGKGAFEVIVYNRKTDPLGNEVIAEDIGDKRSTHWVPAIQK